MGVSTSVDVEQTVAANIAANNAPIVPDVGSFPESGSEF